MLRYYEQAGMIKSIREENNYRYYSKDMEDKLKQILLLRELGFTLKEIERILSTQSIHEVVKIMYQKKFKLKEDMHQLSKLDHIISSFIVLLKTSNKPLDSLLHSLDTTHKMIGEVKMEKESVRIVMLPSMRVASFRAVSETPEDDCWRLVNEFISKHNLTSFRHFGFNNPNPKEGSSVYGYEMWLTIQEDFTPENIKVKHIAEGLYASLTTTMDQIGERWNELYQIILHHQQYDVDVQEEDAFGVSKHQWLEECINYKHFTNPNIDFSEKQLDLLLPIKEK